MIGCEFCVNDCIVDVIICCIRKYFESDNSIFELISIIYGEGYCFIGKIDS